MTTSAERPPCCGRHNGTMLCASVPPTSACCINCPDFGRPDISAATPEVARFLDYLTERIDEIDGSVLQLPEYDTQVWLHTPEQIAKWLRDKFCEVVNAK